MNPGRGETIDEDAFNEGFEYDSNTDKKVEKMMIMKLAAVLKNLGFVGASMFIDKDKSKMKMTLVLMKKLFASSMTSQQELKLILHNGRILLIKLIKNPEFPGANDGSNKGEDEAININLWPQIQGVKIHIIFVMDSNDLCCSHDSC